MGVNHDLCRLPQGPPLLHFGCTIPPGFMPKYSRSTANLPSTKKVQELGKQLSSSAPPYPSSRAMNTPQIHNNHFTGFSSFLHKIPPTDPSLKRSHSRNNSDPIKTEKISGKLSEQNSELIFPDSFNTPPQVSFSLPDDISSPFSPNIISLSSPVKSLLTKEIQQSLSEKQKQDKSTSSYEQRLPFSSNFIQLCFSSQRRPPLAKSSSSTCPFDSEEAKFSDSEHQLSDIEEDFIQSDQMEFPEPNSPSDIMPLTPNPRRLQGEVFDLDDLT